MAIAGRVVKTEKTPKVPYRPRTFIREFDKERQFLPTCLEIQEGIAWKRLQDFPENEIAINAYKDAFNALQCGQNREVALLRCWSCGVTQYGKMAGQKCGYCQETLKRIYP